MKASSILLSFFYALVALALFQDCAQIAAPPGGKKDTLAPQLVQSIPALKTKNYQGKIIALEFNEYINVKNLNQELLVTPGIGFYETKIRPKGLMLTLDSALKPHTTYTFNFRNAIEDVSERNPGKNIKLVFSTGPIIDSLQIQGQIKNAWNNRGVEGALIALYPYTDSLRIDRHKPYYFSKTDTSGNYNIENIAPGKYYAAAFMDQNNNLLLNPAKEAQDFLSAPYIEIKDKNQVQNFRLSMQNSEKIRLLKSTSSAKTLVYEFNQGVKNLTIKQPSNFSLPFQWENEKTLKLYRQDWPAKDTLFAQFILRDSLDRDSLFHVKIKFRENTSKSNAKRQSLMLKNNLPDGRSLSPSDSLVLIFTQPIVQSKLSSWAFQLDSNSTLPISDKDWVFNAEKTKLYLRKKALPKQKAFQLLLPAGSLQNTENDSLVKTSMPLEWEDLENFGKLEGKILQAKSNGTYIVELVDLDKNLALYRQISSSQYSFPYVRPGIYQLRVVEDQDKNGDWTPGQFLKRKRAEPIFFYPEKIKIKANFELTDIHINLENTVENP